MRKGRAGGPVIYRPNMSEGGLLLAFFARGGCERRYIFRG